MCNKQFCNEELRREGAENLIHTAINLQFYNTLFKRCVILSHISFSLPFRRGLNPPHRVKSISMTTFTQQEIEFLQKYGNEVMAMAWSKVQWCFYWHCKCVVVCGLFVLISGHRWVYDLRGNSHTSMIRWEEFLGFLFNLNTCAAWTVNNSFKIVRVVGISRLFYLNDLLYFYLTFFFSFSFFFEGS